MRKNYNIILDIDNTLLHTIETNKHKKMNINGNYQIIRDKDFVIYLRPGLEEFLNYLFTNYNVAIWSAGTKDYVDYIVKKVILNNSNTSQDRKIDFVFSLKHCEQSMKMNIKDENCFKNLKYIWSNKSIPVVIQYYNKLNTLLIDDLYDNCKNQWDNVIWAEFFDVNYAWSQYDKYLYKLRLLLP